MDVTEPASPTPPLTPKRLRTVLAARQAEYEETPDGAIVAWDGIDYTIRVGGPDGAIVRIMAEREVDPDIDELRAFIRTWHAENYWPTLIFGLDDAHQVRLGAHVTADWETGVADRQLDDMLAMSIVKIREAFREVAS